MTDKTLYELEMETPEGRQGLAAAAAASRVGALLEQTFARSELTQDELARALGVTKGRVSQVLHGDGNVHIATVARFLAAMDTQLVISAQGTEGRMLESESRDRRSVDLCRSIVHMTWIDKSGVQTTDVALHHATPSTIPTLAHIERLGTEMPFALQGWAFEAAEQYQDAANKAASAEEIRPPAHV